MTTLQHFKRNWKMYGLTFNSIKLIPCYYDYIRFGRYLAKDWRKCTIGFRPNLNLCERFKALFDTTITEYQSEKKYATKFNIMSGNVAKKIGLIKVWN